MVRSRSTRDSHLLTAPLSKKAYHVSKSKYSIVTADRGENATIKVWSARRASSHHQGQVSTVLADGIQKLHQSASRAMGSWRARVV